MHLSLHSAWLSRHSSKGTSSGRCRRAWTHMREEELGAACKTCNNARRCVTPQLLSHPTVLVIHLKRTKWNTAKMEAERITHAVEANLMVRVPAAQGPLTYNLSGVIYHAGRGKDATSGHYFTEIRVGDQWFMYDDEHIMLSPNWHHAIKPPMRRQRSYKGGLVAVAVYTR
ncbi:hypothetical protein JKP88DRAFT_33062 [Tribonema minus]|uniref:USP domain-containing protein n=1 Tax=Tribonema minus TaxID=303371 RepID=A0A836CJ90_9STRA|nr:hypothetical protein JKP88DRAFT_33062 [Tribonema minus]